MTVTLLAALILAVLMVVFALQNAVPVTITFLSWRFEGSLALVLILSFAAGAVLGLLAALPSFIRKSRTISSQQRKIQDLSAPPPPPPAK